MGLKDWIPLLSVLVASIVAPFLLKNWEAKKAKKTPEQELDEDEKERLGNLREDIKSCRETVDKLEARVDALRGQLAARDGLLEQYWNHYAGCPQLRAEHAESIGQSIKTKGGSAS